MTSNQQENPVRNQDYWIPAQDFYQYCRRAIKNLIAEAAIWWILFADWCLSCRTPRLNTSITMVYWWVTPWCLNII